VGQVGLAGLALQTHATYLTYPTCLTYPTYLTYL